MTAAAPPLGLVRRPGWPHSLARVRGSGGCAPGLSAAASTCLRESLTDTSIWRCLVSNGDEQRDKGAAHRRGQRPSDGMDGRVCETAAAAAAAGRQGD